MAKVNVKVTITNNFPTRKLVDEINKSFVRSIPDKMKGFILAEIRKGNSPVKGKGRFVKYSDIYKKQIRQGRFPGKKVRPINMELTKKMLKSFTVTVLRSKITYAFSDPKAIFHDQKGAGRARTIRRLLPTREKEVFNRKISKQLREAVIKARNRAIKKFNS